MPYTIEYAPDVSALGQLAYQSGYGRRNAERSDLMTRIAAQEAQQARSLAAREQEARRQMDWDREKYVQGADLEQIKAQRGRDWATEDRDMMYDERQGAAEMADERARGLVDYRGEAELNTYNAKAKQKDQKYKMQLDELNHELSLREVGQSSDGGNYSDFTVPQLQQYKDATMRSRMAIKDSVPPEPDQISQEGGNTIIKDQYGRIKRFMPAKDEKAEASAEKRADGIRKLRQAREDYWRKQTDKEDNLIATSEDEVRRFADYDVKRAYPDAPQEAGAGAGESVQQGPNAAQASAPVATGELEQPIIQEGTTTPAQTAAQPVPAIPTMSQISQSISALPPEQKAYLDRQKDTLMEQIQWGKQNGDAAVVEDAKRKLEQLIYGIVPMSPPTGE